MFSNIYFYNKFTLPHNKICEVKKQIKTLVISHTLSYSLMKQFNFINPSFKFVFCFILGGFLTVFCSLEPLAFEFKVDNLHYFTEILGT